MHRHHDIRPVERDCICLLRTHSDPHIAACDSAYRAKFFGTVSAVRNALRAELADRSLLDALGSSPVLN